MSVWAKGDRRDQQVFLHWILLQTRFSWRACRGTACEGARSAGDQTQGHKPIAVGRQCHPSAVELAYITVAAGGSKRDGIGEHGAGHGVRAKTPGQRVGDVRSEQHHVAGPADVGGDVRGGSRRKAATKRSAVPRNDQGVERSQEARCRELCVRDERCREPRQCVDRIVDGVVTKDCDWTSSGLVSTDQDQNQQGNESERLHKHLGLGLELHATSTGSGPVPGT